MHAHAHSVLWQGPSRDLSRRVIVRCAAPSIALVSLLAMSKREPEPLLPVQPQQNSWGTVAVATAEQQQVRPLSYLLRLLLLPDFAAVPPVRERSERSGPERVPATFRTGANERSGHLWCTLVRSLQTPPHH